MDQPTSLAIIGVAAALSPIITALGIVYNSRRANQAAKVVDNNQATIDHKLDDIHVLVNDQLTKAVERATAAETKNEVLFDLLAEMAPDNPAVVALMKERG